MHAFAEKVTSKLSRMLAYSPSRIYESNQAERELTSIDYENEAPASARSTCSTERFEDAIEPQRPWKLMPNLTDESAFVYLELYEFLQASLPNMVQGCHWVLLYSTLRDGISFRTLIRKSAALSGPGLLIVGDRKGAVFGGLLDCPLKPCPRRKYQGTNQTFVFTNIYGEPRLFRATGANRYFYLCLNDMIAFGGGSNFALSLDGDLLTGSSGPCETFGNLCLAHDSMFELKNVEVLRCWLCASITSYSRSFPSSIASEGRNTKGYCYLIFFESTWCFAIVSKCTGHACLQKLH